MSISRLGDVALGCSALVILCSVIALFMRNRVRRWPIFAASNADMMPLYFWIYTQSALKIVSGEPRTPLWIQWVGAISPFVILGTIGYLRLRKRRLDRLGAGWGLAMALSSIPSSAYLLHAPAGVIVTSIYVFILATIVCFVAYTRMLFVEKLESTDAATSPQAQ